jgi:hypothetical protein
MNALILLALGLGAPLSNPATPQDAPGVKLPELPNPFILKKDELMAGNPLAQYVEMLRLEPDYLKDVKLLEAYNGQPLPPGMASSYVQARATVEGNLGAIQRSLKSQTIGWFYNKPKKPITSSELDKLKPVDAVGFIAKQGETHNWIMLGEEHMKPQTRSILSPLLRELQKKGFTYFAAETFYDNVASLTSAGYPTWDSGYYLQDPVFAEAVREAIRLGYKLVEYEKGDQPKDPPADDPWFGQNYREHGQAENLKTRIFDKDPKAKVLVWAGRSHVIKQSSKQPDGEFRPMGYEFKRMTGVDAFAAYLPTYVEAGGPEWEQPLFKYVNAKGWVKKPTVFVDKAGAAYGAVDDAVAVFFPRTTYERGRPDWLRRDVGRVPVEIPSSFLKGEGLMLAQAWLEGEPVQAVPVDQVLIVPGDPVPVLMLPKGRRCWFRVIDGAGAVLGTG